MRCSAARPALPDARVHHPREAGEHIDGRVDPPAPEVAREDDLALGDVAGEVRDRVGHVVVRAASRSAGGSASPAGPGRARLARRAWRGRCTGSRGSRAAPGSPRARWTAHGAPRHRPARPSSRRGRRGRGRRPGAPRASGRSVASAAARSPGRRPGSGRAAIRSRAPEPAKTSSKYAASRRVIPMAAKTVTKRASPRRRAPMAIRAARSFAGQPRPGEDRQLLAADQGGKEVDGAVTPVSMKSRGLSRATGLMAPPSTSTRRTGTIGGPPSIGLPRPSIRRPSIAAETPRRNGSPVGSTTVACRFSPPVPS